MDSEINFKPITDGLGFHPFEDGLPYAPAAKKQTGTGAVSAGRAQFSYPPAIPAPMGKPIDATAEKIRRELESIQTQRIEQARAMAERIHSPLEVHRTLSYSVQRASAYLLDSAFNLSICASILSTALISSDLSNLKTITDPALITVCVFLFICNWALLAAQEVAFGTSLGKRIFGLRLEGTGIECLVRSVLFIPSLLLAGIGVFSALFDSKKRCWHDRATLIQPT